MRFNWDSIRWWSWRSLQVAMLAAVVVFGVYWYVAAVPVIEHQIEAGELVAEVMTSTYTIVVSSASSPITLANRYKGTR